VLNEATAEGARVRAEVLCEKVRELSILDSGRVIAGFSFSIGVASYPENGRTLAELLESADKALYRAKETGRNRVCVADRVTEVTSADD
jgi:diguanylate cyclase (GGDEF)-like protein